MNAKTERVANKCAHNRLIEVHTRFVCEHNKHTYTPKKPYLVWISQAFFFSLFLQIVEPKLQNFSWHNKRTQSTNIKKQKWYVPNKNTFVHFEYLNIRTYVPFAQRYCTILRAKEGKQAQICAIFLIKSLSQMNCSRRLCNIVIIFAYFNRAFVVWFLLVVCLPFACSLALWLVGWLVSSLSRRVISCATINESLCIPFGYIYCWLFWPLHCVSGILISFVG